MRGGIERPLIDWYYPISENPSDFEARIQPSVSSKPFEMRPIVQPSNFIENDVAKIG